MSTRLVHILDLILKNGPLNVHAGEVEVRPPHAPTGGPNRRSPVGKPMAT